jgi:hypothetical protein
MEGAKAVLQRLFSIVGAGAVVAGTAVVGFPATGSAAPVASTCTGPIGPAQFNGLSVPSGAQCQIVGPVSVSGSLSIGQAAVVFVAPSGSLNVGGRVTVAGQGVFADLQNSSPVRVGGPVFVANDAVFVAGTETPGGPIVNSFGGPVIGTQVSSVQIHNANIAGSVVLAGGGAVNPVIGPGVNFNDLEDNHIGGNVVETGYTGVWAGVIRNTIKGNLVFAKNSDMDEFDIGSNTVAGNAVCVANNPAVNTGGSPGSPNTVAGHNTCG